MHRVALLCGLAALALPAQAAAYDWPLKPFDVQHPVRGSFDDPRRDMAADGEPTQSFHSGIDISAPDGTPVYAIQSGWVSLRRSAVVVSTLSRHVFGYWHVHPAVRDGTLVTRHELLGRIEAGWGHVHLSESLDGVYLNPLRPGGITPYVDLTPPTIADVLVEANGHPVSITAVSGTVDLVVDAYDTPPLAPPGPWADTRVTPALVRWRLSGPDWPTAPWRTAVDFRRRLMPSFIFDYVFAPGTRQNRAGRPGCYLFYLARGLDTRELPNAVYQLEVTASDTRGNKSTSVLPLRVVNQSLKTV